MASVCFQQDAETSGTRDDQSQDAKEDQSYDQDNQERLMHLYRPSWLKSSTDVACSHIDSYHLDSTDKCRKSDDEHDTLLATTFRKTDVVSLEHVAV
jgi:hypothetical protein